MKPSRPALAPEPAPAPLNGNGDLTGARLLLVDDEVDAREVLAKLLRRANATVEVAGSADEAIERYTQNRPDLLISDIAMPSATDMT
jgi:CheY-like chemotaxis protein